VVIRVSRKAHIRENIEHLDGVARTYLEWTIQGAHLIRTLTVEVNFDTDPASGQCRMDVLEQIRAIVIGGQDDEPAMAIANVRIAPVGTVKRGSETT
jgi:hypothetical protein